MLKEYILSNVKPEDYYKARFPQWDQRSRTNVLCPFHEDKSPSLSIALRNGGAKCHASSCGRSFGNIVHFESELKQIPEKIAARKIYREFIRPTISAKYVANLRDNLLCSGNYILKIKKEMGLSLKTIRKFNLGLDSETNRVTIPIYDQFGHCVNLRYYRLPSQRQSNEVKIYNEKGFGKLDLFPWLEINTFSISEPVYFMASEKECLLALQGGLCAFTTTAGEGSWNPAWDSFIANRHIVLVFDRDSGGKMAEQKIARAFAPNAKSVTPITLPFRTSRPDRKDFADWIIKENHSVEDLKRIVNNERSSNPSSNWRVHVVRSDSDVDSNDTRHVGESSILKGEENGDLPELPEFASDKLIDIIEISSNVSLLNQRIRTQGIVSAKSPNTYSIPWKFAVTVKSRPEFEYQVPMGRFLLRFIRASDTDILHLVQKLVGSNSAEIKPMAYISVTEVEIIPTAVIDQDVPYVVQRCFYFGDRIEANVPYYLEVIPTSEIRTQETIGIITHRDPISRSLEKFTLTAEIEANLSFFKPEDGESVWDKLTSLANEISIHHSRIYNRLDWHLVALLTWASPVGWRFPAEPELQRGWLNSLALGDTETGKSKLAKKLQEIFKCGVFVNAENCTYVGLVGGAIKGSGDRLMLRWGRIPLSDKQLVILEELSGLSVEEISDMSEVRSSGVARLNKGGITAETNCRTRLLCLSNVRGKRKSLAGYLFGVHAIHELIGHGEDIARFDLITTLIDREVSVDIINSSQFALNAKKTEQTIATDQYQSLIRFIWALKPEQIKFTTKAYNACLDETKRLSGTFHPSIPIFKGGSGRYKLGRLGAAIACLQFSWTGKHIEVNRNHIQAAARLLELIYNKPSFGYFQYSQQMFDRESISNGKFIESELRKKIPGTRLTKVLTTLIHATRFTKDELMAIAGLNVMYVDHILGVFVREGVINKGEANVWNITPAGKTFLEKLINK